jgi:hypothetical protein
MDGIAAILTPMCPEVQIIDVGIDPDRADGWDAADALKAGWTLEAFEAWAAPRAKVFRPTNEHPKALACISGLDLWNKDYPTAKCLIAELLPEASCSFNAGPSGVRKTWLELEFAIAVVTGKPVLERFNISKPGPVLMIMGEDSLQAVRKRMQLLARGKRLHAANLKDLYFIEASGVLSSEEKCKELADLCEKHGPRLIILDPFVRMHTCDENSAQEIQPILSYLRELSRRFGVSILVTHHLKKNREDGGGRKMELMRGSGDIGAWADTVFILSRQGEDAEAPTEVTIAKQRDMVEHPPFAFTLELEGPKDAPAARLKYQEPGAAEGRKVLAMAGRILEELNNQPGGIPKKELLDGLKGNNDLRREAFKQLETEKNIEVRSEKREAKDGKKRELPVVYLAHSTPAHAPGQGLAEVAPPTTPTPAPPFRGAGVDGLVVPSVDTAGQGLAGIDGAAPAAEASLRADDLADLFGAVAPEAIL